jgi:hypothetical protein
VTTPFDPSLPISTAGLGGAPSTTPTGYLPNGQYDIYNLGKIWDSTLYLGNEKRKQAGPYAGTDVVMQGRNSSQTVVSPVTSTPYEYMKDFASWSVTNPDQYQALQAQLYAAGFYSKKPRLGVYTADDAAAMKKAITGYLGVVNPDNPNPLTLSDYLDHASASGAAQQKAEDQASAPVIQVTDPAAIRQAAQQAFQAATGRGATKKQLDKFVAQFQSAQKSAQTAGSGSTVSAPDLSSQAMQFAQQEDPQDYAQNQRQSYLNALVNLFAPSGSERPNMTPVPKA